MKQSSIQKLHHQLITQYYCIYYTQFLHVLTLQYSIFLRNILYFLNLFAFAFFVCLDLSFFTSSSLPIFFDVASTPALLHTSRRHALASYSYFSQTLKWSLYT